MRTRTAFLGLVPLLGFAMQPLAAQDVDPRRAVTLTVEQAQALKPKGELSFDKLTELSPAVAAELAKQATHLRFPALQGPSPETVAALAPHPHGLTFSGLRDLSPDLAAAFARHEGSALTLGGFTTLSADASRTLTACKGTLTLADVSTLSEEAAAALATCSKDVHVPGLTTLTSVPLATKLGLQGGVNLGRMTRISDEAARGLFSVSPQAKNIEYSLGLEEISLETAKAIADRGRAVGGHLHFHGVQSIPDDVAEALAFPGAIRFHKVVKISDRVAKALTRFNYVHMYAVSDLSPEALEIISRAASFQVHGLRRIDSVPFASTLLTQNNVFLTLNKVESFSDEAAEALAKGGKDKKCPPLPALQELTSVPLAELLAAQKGPLSLPQLTRVTDDAVRALAAHQGPLGLGLTTLSPGQAASLAARADPTSLGVTELGDDAAAKLAAARGPIAMPHLKKISAAAAAALRGNAAIEIPKTID